MVQFPGPKSGPRETFSKSDSVSSELESERSNIDELEMFPMPGLWK